MFKVSKRCQSALSQEFGLFFGHLINVNLRQSFNNRHEQPSPHLPLTRFRGASSSTRESLTPAQSDALPTEARAPAVRVLTADLTQFLEVC